MTTKFSIMVHLTNGEAKTFPFDEATSFEFMAQGFFFVHSQIAKTAKQTGSNLKGMKYRYVRTWIPNGTIKDIEVITEKEITDPEELAKYVEFLKHGVDIMVTKISHTNPPTEEEIKEKAAKETKVVAKPAEGPATPEPVKKT